MICPSCPHLHNWRFCNGAGDGVAPGPFGGAAQGQVNGCLFGNSKILPPPLLPDQDFLLSLRAQAGAGGPPLYSNFDITLDHFSRISQPHPTPRAPCAMLYSGVLIGAWDPVTYLGSVSDPAQLQFTSL